MPKQSEADFLATYQIHDFEVPLTSVDVVIFTVQSEQLHVLLVKRAEHPYFDQWALPGGFILLEEDGSLTQTAARKLYEKTHVKSPYLEQLQTIGNRHRDPRGWSVTVVYFALIPSDGVRLHHGSGTSDAQWHPLSDGPLPTLAFDHATVLNLAISRLRSKVEYTNLPLHLLPDMFTLSDLQRVFEIVLNRKVDKSAFRRRIREANLLTEVTGQKRLGSNRPAQLYQVRDPSYTHFFARNIIGKTPTTAARK